MKHMMKETELELFDTELLDIVQKGETGEWKVLEER